MAKTNTEAVATPPQPMELACPRPRLMAEIQSVLSDGLVKPRYRVAPREREAIYDGHTYHGTEAFWFLSGGAQSGLSVTRGELATGEPHWWLVDGHGRVIDITLGPDEARDVDYGSGRTRSFRRGSGRGGISKTAEEVVIRVERARQGR